MIATASAFEAPYQDNGVLANLISKIENCRIRWCERDGVPFNCRLYAPYIPIVQATMMGKSRMFFNLPQLNVFVFYFCLQEEKSCGYPRGIPLLTNTLTGPCTEGFYSAFLLAALEALDKFKQEFKGDNPVFSAWFSEQQRPEFWKEIIGL
jgi:hypothetical protein